MSLSADLAAALRRDGGGGGGGGGELLALGLAQRLERLRGSAEVTDAVAAGPPGAGPPTWGARFSAALAGGGGGAHSAAFVAFEAAGGLWQLLEVLSDAKGLAPQQRGRFYAQFEDEQLLSSLIAALGARGPAQSAVRRCIRNLSRAPEPRRRLIPAAPILVENLSEAGLARDSAAALCNVCCHGDAKSRAVECGAVRQVLAPLKMGDLASDVAEDLVACLGVLTGGFEQGLAALFALAAEEGEAQTFAPMISLLGSEAHEDAYGLQCLIMDVLGGICAASPQFKAWLIGESEAVKTELPALLRSEDASVRQAALQFAGLLSEADNFRAAFVNAGGVQALQALLEMEPPVPAVGGERQDARIMAPIFGGGARRGVPSTRELTQFLLSKVLLI